MGKVTVGGHWLVEEKIGEGSFGEVFRGNLTFLTTVNIYVDIKSNLKRARTSSVKG